MTHSIKIEKEHGYLFMTLGAIALHIIAIGFSTMKSRLKVFNKEFMKKHFGEEHKKLTGEDIGISKGYPDMGNGYYAKQLSYEHWLEFNNAQRGHYNYLEMIASILILTTLAGVLYPLYATYFGVAFLFSRISYTIFYKTKKGASHPLRGVGQLVTLASILGNFILTMYSGYQISHGV